MGDYDWIGPAVQGVASAFGEAKAGELTAQQQRMLEEMYANLRDIPLPELERVQAEQLGPSAMEDVRSDPEQRSQQLQVMDELRNLFENGGFNIEDRAAMAEAMNRANVAGSAQRNQLAGEFAQRGQLGSGARLALGNMNAQGAANRASRSGQDIAARGEARRMDALGKYGAMAGSLRTQDFGENAQRAAAKDAANRWNASAREKAGYYNAGRPQQQFSNQVTRATGQQSAGNNLSSFFGNEAQGTRNQYANYGRAGAEAARGIASSFGSKDDDEEESDWGDGY